MPQCLTIQYEALGLPDGVVDVKVLLRDEIFIEIEAA